MISHLPYDQLPDNQRVVITGLGLTAPNGNSIGEFREALLNNKSGVQEYEIRYFGKTLAGVCDFDVRRHQTRKDARRGTRAGSCLLYTSPSPRDATLSRMPSSA